MNKTPVRGHRIMLEVTKSSPKSGDGAVSGFTVAQKERGIITGTGKKKNSVK
jgi:hypothetical protein